MAFGDKKAKRRPVTTGIRSTNEYYASSSGSALSRGMRGSRPSGIPLPKPTNTVTSADTAYYREGKPAGQTKASPDTAEITIRSQQELQRSLEQILGLVRQGKTVRIVAPAEGHEEITTALRNAARKAGTLKKFRVQLVALPSAASRVEDAISVTEAPPDLPDAERNLPKANVAAPLASEVVVVEDRPPASEFDTDGGSLAVTDSDSSIGPEAIAAFTGRTFKTSEADAEVFDRAGTVNITEPPAPAAATPLSEDEREAMAPEQTSKRSRRRRRFSTPTDET